MMRDPLARHSIQSRPASGSTSAPPPARLPPRLQLACGSPPATHMVHEPDPRRHVDLLLRARRNVQAQRHADARLARLALDRRFSDHCCCFGRVEGCAGRSDCKTRFISCSPPAKPTRRRTGGRARSRDRPEASTPQVLQAVNRSVSFTERFGLTGPSCGRTTGMLQM